MQHSQRITIWSGLFEPLVMRDRAEWMRPVDDKILEHLDDVRRNLPANMADIEQIDATRNYIGSRCRLMEEHGLLRDVGRGLYPITDDGRRYLRGDLDARDLDG